MNTTPNRLFERLVLLCLVSCWTQVLPRESSAAVLTTLPEELPPAVTEMPEMSKLPWVDPEGFLPPRKAGANGADLYAQAAATIRRLPGFPSIPVDLDAYEKDPILREAMRLAFEGATQKEADFFKIHRYRAWEQGSSPDLWAAFIVSRAMSRGARNYLEKNDQTTATMIAKATVGMGEHFLTQAPNLPQALIAQAIMEEGMRALVACYRAAGDTKNADEVVERLDQSSGIEEADQLRPAPATLVRWNDVAMALKSLSDPDPVIRADTASLIEACFDSDGFRRMKKEGESAKIAMLIRANKASSKKALKPLLNDPHPVVRRMAKRAMDALDKSP